MQIGVIRSFNRADRDRCSLVVDWDNELENSRRRSRSYPAKAAKSSDGCERATPYKFIRRHSRHTEVTISAEFRPEGTGASARSCARNAKRIDCTIFQFPDALFGPFRPERLRKGVLLQVDASLGWPAGRRRVHARYNNAISRRFAVKRAEERLNYQLDRPVCAYRGVLSNGRSNEAVN